MTQDDAFSYAVKWAAELGVDWAEIVSQAAHEIPVEEVRAWEECCQ